MSLRRTNTRLQFDKDKAAREFGNAKPDSFKRQIWVIGKKIKDAMENGVPEGEERGAPVKTMGRKRKAEGDEADPKRKKKGKAKEAEVEAEVKVKSEGEDDGEEELG